ncbi:unnamed protein product [Chrysoparadoxa australica]
MKRTRQGKGKSKGKVVGDSTKVKRSGTLRDFFVASPAPEGSVPIPTPSWGGLVDPWAQRRWQAVKNASDILGMDPVEAVPASWKFRSYRQSWRPVFTDDRPPGVGETAKNATAVCNVVFGGGPGPERIKSRGVMEDKRQLAVDRHRANMSVMWSWLEAHGLTETAIGKGSKHRQVLDAYVGSMESSQRLCMQLYHSSKVWHRAKAGTEVPLLCHKLDVSPSAILSLEVLTTDELRRVCKSFGVPVMMQQAGSATSSASATVTATATATTSKIPAKDCCISALEAWVKRGEKKKRLTALVNQVLACTSDGDIVVKLSAGGAEALQRVQAAYFAAADMSTLDAVSLSFHKLENLFGGKQDRPASDSNSNQEDGSELTPPPLLQDGVHFDSFYSCLLQADMLDFACSTGVSSAAYTVVNEAATSLLPPSCTKCACQDEAGAPACNVCELAALVVWRGIHLLEREKLYDQALYFLDLLLERAPSLSSSPMRARYFLRKVIDLQHDNGRKVAALEACELALREDTLFALPDVLPLRAQLLKLAQPPLRWKKPKLPVLREATQKELVLELKAMKSQGWSVERAVLAHVLGDLSLGGQQQPSKWKGMHAENSLLLSFFALLCWDILFDIPSSYSPRHSCAAKDLKHGWRCFSMRQAAALDKLTAMVEAGGAASLIERTWRNHWGEVALGMNWRVFESLEEWTDVAECMGPKVLATAVRNLAANYQAWSHGLPDLFLWEPAGKQCQWIEVKVKRMSESNCGGEPPLLTLNYLTLTPHVSGSCCCVTTLSSLTSAAPRALGTV